VKFSLRAAGLRNEEKGKLRSAAVMDGVGGSFLVGVACFRSGNAHGIVAKISPLRRLAFCEAAKRQQKTLLWL